MCAHVHLLPPTRCETLAVLVERFGGSFELRKATGASSRECVHYPLPTQATFALMRYLAPFQDAELEPDFIARLPGGRIYGAGAVLSPDGTSIALDVSTDFGSQPGQHWLQTFDRIRPPMPLTGATAVGAVNLGARYCHWLLEELPRLLALAKASTAELPKLIAHGRTGFAREASVLGGWGARMVEVGRSTHFACEQLIVPSLIGRPGLPTRRGIELLTELTAPLCRSASARGERLYITRENAERRRVSNEDQLWPQLAARGFVKLQLEAMPWAEQINAFAHAREIVAPHGGGLANLIFCRPGTRVVEFFNPAYVNPCFWRLAAITGLDYRPLVSGGDDAAPLGFARETGRLDIEADIDAILRAINRD